MTRVAMQFGIIVGVALFAPATASAVNTIIAGNHLLLPNTPGQVIQIVSMGDAPVSGVNLSVSWGDGGPNWGGSIVGPIITAIDIVGPGTIFDSNNTGQWDFVPGDQIAQAGTTTQSGTIDPNGVLANLTVDTTGLSPGFYLLSVSGNNAIGLPASDWAGSPAVTTAWQDGGWVIVPEPSSFGIMGVAGIGVAAIAILRCRKGKGVRKEGVRTLTLFCMRSAALAYCQSSIYRDGPQFALTPPLG